MTAEFEIKGVGRLEFKDGILIVRLQEGLEITAPILENINREGIKLANQTKFCVLADVRLNISSTPEARRFGADNIYMKHHLAYAMLADSTPVILLSNFFIRVNQPKIPTKLFKKEADALAWLEQFLA